MHALLQGLFLTANHRPKRSAYCRLILFGLLAHSVFPVSAKKCEYCEIFNGIFSLLFGNCEWRFLIFEITAFLFGFSVWRNTIFSSSSAASGAVSLKLDSKVSKVAEKDALRYLKTFFVSFVLKYADKQKKSLDNLRVR